VEKKIKQFDDDNLEAINGSRELYTTTEIGEMFGLTSTAVAQWGIIPAGRKGRANLYSMRDVIKYKLTKNEGEINEKQERARKIKFDADRAEIELKILEGKLVNYEDVVTAYGEFSTTIKTMLMALPTTLAPALEGLEKREIFNILTKEFDVLLLDAISVINEKT